MKFLLGALVALSLFSGCTIAAVPAPTTIQIVGSDGYTFNPTHTRAESSPSITIKIVKYTNFDDMNKEFARQYPNDPNPKGYQVKAFSQWNAGGTVCTIFMIDPKVYYEPMYLGHELVHCMYGDFHHGQHKPNK